MADSRPKKAKICLCIFLCLLVGGIIAVVVGVRMWRHSSENMKWNGTGSTARFQEIILERCYKYTQSVQPELRGRDCQKIREAFRNAFISKDPCSATEEDYHPLMKLVNQMVPCDKTVFWSKSKELAHQYTKVQRDMFTLEDTLMGYIADDLNWCGVAGSYEMNYQSCPHWKEDCSNNFVSVFWDLVSKRHFWTCGSP